jgi:hypothetical protein
VPVSIELSYKAIEGGQIDVQSVLSAEGPAFAETISRSPRC